jgi:hypothetical protein
MAQHVAQLKLLNLVESLGIELVEVVFADEAVFHEVEPKCDFFYGTVNVLATVNPKMQVLDFAHLCLSCLLVLPKVGHMSAQLFFFNFYYLVVDVKDTSSTRPCVLVSLLVGLA